jgi:hypothetical protein
MFADGSFVAEIGPAVHGEGTATATGVAAVDRRPHTATVISPAVTPASVGRSAVTSMVESMNAANVSPASVTFAHTVQVPDSRRAVDSVKVTVSPGPRLVWPVATVVVHSHPWLTAVRVVTSGPDFLAHPAGVVKSSAPAPAVAWWWTMTTSPSTAVAGIVTEPLVVVPVPASLMSAKSRRNGSVAGRGPA